MGWIGVDLDGTLAYYDEWRGVEHIGDPIAPMVLRVKRWLAEGHEVRIVTARVGIRPGVELNVVLAAIERWCLTHIGQVLLVTDRKDYGMACLYDDRCRQVETNTGRLIGESREGRDK